MKKYFIILAASAAALTGCKKPGPDPDPTPDGGYLEKTFVVNISMIDGVTTNYSGGNADMPGDAILDFLGISEEEFVLGMGTLDGNALEKTTSQVDQQGNPVMFGVAEYNNTENLTWVPETSSNFGHWFNAEGALASWSDDDSFFFTESTYGDWGVADADRSGLWNYGYGIRPDHYTGKAGDKYTFTEVFFLTDDDEVERYAYVQWNVTIEAAQEISLQVVDTYEISYDVDYEGDYSNHEIDLSRALNAIGASDAKACDVYGVNADGSYSKAPGKNFWFSAAGDISSWGEGCGICINDDDNDGVYGWCMFPDANLAGQTVFGTIAVANGTKAAVVKIVAKIAGIEAVQPADESAMKDVDVTVELTVTAEGASAKYAEQILPAFQISAEQISAAINAGQISCTAYVNGEAVEPTAGGMIGNWFDVNGNAISFGAQDEAGNNLRSYFVEFYDDFSAGCGFYESDSAGVNGKTISSYSQKITFTAPSGKTATATVSYKLTFNTL